MSVYFTFNWEVPKAYGLGIYQQSLAQGSLDVEPISVASYWEQETLRVQDTQKNCPQLLPRVTAVLLYRTIYRSLSTKIQSARPQPPVIRQTNVLKALVKKQNKSVT